MNNNGHHPTRFQKRAIMVNGIRWTGDNEEDVGWFASGCFELDDEGNAQVYDRLHDSWINVNRGDWVLRGVQGEFYPIKDDVLAATYDPVY